MPASHEVEIARHDLRLEQLAVELGRVREELEEEREQRRQDRKDLDDIKQAAAAARVVFIVAVAIGSFGSWVLGVTDHVRRYFSASH